LAGKLNRVKVAALLTPGVPVAGKGWLPWNEDDDEPTGPVCEGRLPEKKEGCDDLWTNGGNPLSWGKLKEEVFLGYCLLE